MVVFISGYNQKLHTLYSVQYTLFFIQIGKEQPFLFPSLDFLKAYLYLPVVPVISEGNFKRCSTSFQRENQVKNNTTACVKTAFIIN